MKCDLFWAMFSQKKGWKPKLGKLLWVFMLIVSLLHLLVFRILFYFFKWYMGVVKLGLGYVNMEWSFPVFLNLAVNQGQIPRWSKSDFARPRPYFLSFQVPPFSQTYVLMTDLQVIAQGRSSRPATNCLCHVCELTQFCWASLPSSTEGWLK